MVSKPQIILLLIARKYIYASWQNVMGVGHETIGPTCGICLYLRVIHNHIIHTDGDVVMKIYAPNVLSILLVIIIFVFMSVISTLILLGASKQTMPTATMGVCKIIIPHGKIEEGWKFWDPAENGNISNLLRDGKAEIDSLPGLVECTVYGHNQTPVTTSSALAMWRRK